MEFNNNDINNNDQHSKDDINNKKGIKSSNESVLSSESEVNIHNNEIIKSKGKISTTKIVSSCYLGLNNNTLRNNDRHNKKDINIKKGNKYFNEGVSSSESEFNNNNEIIKRK